MDSCVVSVLAHLWQTFLKENATDTARIGLFCFAAKKYKKAETSTY